jgi:ornithine carbamoyltransferase
MAPPGSRSSIYDILSESSLRGRDLLSISDLSTEEALLVLDVAGRLKAGKFDETQTLCAKGQTLAMLFEKPSLRTRVTFEAGMTQLGGHAIYLEGKLGNRETVPDVARNRERWVDGIMARTFSHQTVVDLAANASIPVVNGLSDYEHPCQALADFLTIIEHRGSTEGQKIAFIGDGNNVCNSLMLLAAKLGAHYSLGCPPGYEVAPEVVAAAAIEAAKSGATITITNDVDEAADGADVIYTDVWSSMGQEDQQKEREAAFAAYQVNSPLISRAKDDVIVLHCLPAHRGEEITAEVIDGPHAVVFDQAENRLHAQKAVLALVL